MIKPCGGGLEEAQGRAVGLAMGSLVKTKGDSGISDRSNNRDAVER
jgi:hypothetical protein